MLKYARIKVFYRLMTPFADKMRRRRSLRFSKMLNLKPGMRVIDLGGTPGIWKYVPTPLNVVMINLDLNKEHEKIAETVSQHKFTFMIGDACATSFETNSFDLVFSNSVIEHVGDAARQRAFAEEVKRLAPRHWIQTPAKAFPIEAHTGMPFWWYYPEPLRARIMEGWRVKLPEWSEMIGETTFVEKKAMKAFFPDSQIYIERFSGLPKSYIAVKN